MQNFSLYTRVEQQNCQQVVAAQAKLELTKMWHDLPTHSLTPYLTLRHSSCFPLTCTVSLTFSLSHSQLNFVGISCCAAVFLCSRFQFAATAAAAAASIYASLLLSSSHSIKPLVELLAACSTCTAHKFNPSQTWPLISIPACASCARCDDDRLC